MQAAFGHLNLSYNPFGELPLEEKAKLMVGEFESYASKLEHPGYVLQIMGEMGRGKSSFLLGLRRHFPDAPYYYYPEDGPKPTVAKAPLLFLDEMQRFTPKERKRILQQRASFVISTHKDFKEEYEALGLRHEAICLQGLSKDKLQRILKKRLEAARRSPGPIPYFEDRTLEKLLERFGDDLRSMEDYLYEIFQSLKVIGAIKID
ncbi:MAG: hypothetical protein KC422_17910 [Trueperaceae bacterium]|nr:hypothetical protein [Trueperaceae bacterium]